MTEEYMEEMEKTDSPEEVFTTPHLAVDESNHVVTPSMTEQYTNWVINYTLWRDVHGVWHDIFGRWRDNNGIWHDAPYDAGDYIKIHYIDHAFNHIINYTEDFSDPSKPLTPTEENLKIVPNLNFAININLQVPEKK